MKLHKNLFSLEELEIINKIISHVNIPVQANGEYVNFESNGGTGLCERLGRLQIGNISYDLPKDIVDKLTKIANTQSEVPLIMSHAMYVEYSGKHGSPNLPPHFDRDTNNLIINLQLSSNTHWDLGINVDTYRLEDNSALIFNGNTNIHWRVHKEFQEDEYVKMLFIRFHDPKNRPDYSHLSNDQDYEAFKEAIETRARIHSL